MGYRQGGLRALLALGLAGQVAACGSVPRTAYTAEQAALASVPGIPGARVYADASVDTIAELAGNPLRRSAGFNYLALSGGGGDGAYGAGVLNGWTASGTRPEFTLVSGVSTGALIAPFAFLGPAYDAYLTEFYTSGVAGELVTSPSISNILFGSGLFGDGRLRNLIARYVTPELLTAIAEEHAKGRRLMVVTTNLDSQRSVIWNMGAIASSGAPNALDLFRDVLAASASVPAVFPPQMIDVNAADARFQEMHVDGSVVTPVFTLPQTLLLRDGKIRTGGKANIYVVINGRLEPDFEVTKNNTLSIVERSFTTASRARSRATLTATYALARSNGMSFNLTYIDEDGPKASAAKGFDTAYMRALYQEGLGKGRTGTFWQHTVPASPTLKQTAAAVAN
ncbi:MULTISPECIES: patatin-like phospholipase family protein [unclassified Methylobacterium]|uniref:patatin-like phospholipase family protein n=1 Tax=unclassified Methylobacterium TaxID=2615210 RepID=UPI0011C1D6F9|nr:MULTISPECIES: patatin-like phospholipase family protein [unclassified Methylobacterium]QEE40234.1 alpha/beta hydrolase [Methylobacterium sp. WL1]TXN58473.1 alpha/beta hydrolase [Methylobacterium sp. WL2]